MKQQSTKHPQKNQRPKPHKSRVIGLDLHPDIFTACFLQGQTNRDASITKRSIDISIHDLETWAQTHVQPNDLIVVEASGNTFHLVRRLHEIGFLAIVLESKQVSKTASAYIDDDVIAAERIARAYLTGLYKEVWTPDPLTIERRELLHRYQNAKKSETRAINELKGFLNQYHIRLGSKNLRQTTQQKHILQLRDWSPLQIELLAGLFRNLTFSVEESAKLLEFITQQVLSVPNMRGCLRLLGIGPVNAFAIVAAVGDIRRFHTANKLVGYLGLSPGNKKSGRGKDIKVGIGGNRGRSQNRAYLIQAAQTIFRQKKDNPLKETGMRIFMRNGNRNIAIAAIARKLAIQLYHLLNGRGITREEQRRSLETKLSKMIRSLEKPTLTALGLPPKTTKCIQQIITQIDQPFPETN